MLTEAATNWLTEVRHLEPEIADNLGVTVFEKGNGGSALSFAYIVAGQVVNHKYRTFPDKRFWMDEGARLVLWNYDVITDTSLSGVPLIITEGEFDALAAIQSGFPRVVSVPNGAPAESIEDQSAARYQFVETALPDLKAVREIILAVDNDGPGLALLNDLSVRLGRGKCKFVTYPYDKEKTRRLKDLNEVLVVYGENGVKRTLEGAQWCKVSGVGRMSEMPPSVSPNAVSTGFKFLDEHYRVRLGDLCVVTGIPSMGKSSFLNDFACRMAQTYGWVVCFASFEQDPQRDHKRALREWRCERPERDCTETDLIDADAWIDSQFAFINIADDDIPDLKWLMDRIATAVVRFNVKMAIVDPWNELEHSRDRNMSETEYTGFAIRQLKALAKKLGIHLIIAVHPTKIEMGPDGKYPMPGLYSIAGSAHWYNKPDIGIVIHRPEKSSSLSVINIEKVRYREAIGHEGSEWMTYNPTRRRFSEAVAPEEIEAAKQSMKWSKKK